MAATSISSPSRPRKADAPTPADAAFGALVLFPLALAAVALTLPILAVGFAVALPPLVLWRLTGWRVLRVLACVPAAYEVGWYRLHGIDPRPLSAPYLATQRVGAEALIMRLHGAEMATIQASLAQWRDDSTALALLLGSLVAVGLVAFPPAFLRRPGTVSPEGERRRRAAEHGTRNTTLAPTRTTQALGNAAHVLYDLDHRRNRQRVRLAGDHFTIGAVSMMHGPSGVGKSRWLSEVVRAIIRGEPVFGWPTVPGAVVWVTEEALTVWRDKAALMIREEERALRWWQRWLRRRYPRRYPPAVWPISLPDMGLEPNAETFPALVALIERQVQHTGAKLVILDTLMACCPQAVKDNEIAKVFVRQCAGLATRCGVAVEIVHHDNNAGTPLGAKMIKGAVDYTHHVYAPEDAEDDRLRVVEFGKRYEPYPPPPLVYRMRDDGRLEAVDDGAGADGVDRGDGAAERAGLEPAPRRAAPRVPQEEHAESVLAPAPEPAVPAERERVLAVVREMVAAEGYATLNQVVLVTGLPKTTGWKLLKRLERDGVLLCAKAESKTAPARWTLTGDESAA